VGDKSFLRGSIISQSLWKFKPDNVNWSKQIGSFRKIFGIIGVFPEKSPFWKNCWRRASSFFKPSRFFHANPKRLPNPPAFPSCDFLFEKSLYKEDLKSANLKNFPRKWMNMDTHGSLWNRIFGGTSMISWQNLLIFRRTWKWCWLYKSLNWGFIDHVRFSRAHLK